MYIAKNKNNSYHFPNVTGICFGNKNNLPVVRSMWLEGPNILATKTASKQRPKQNKVNKPLHVVNKTYL